MQTVETTGKSLKDATEAAARLLGASPDQIQVTVLEEHKGLFGKATVRIRAEYETAAVAKEEAVAEEPVAAPEPEPASEPQAQEVFAEAETEPHEHADATEDDASKLLELLQGILKVGDLDVSAKTLGISGRYVNIELDGRDVAFLVGKHGEVLNALQYVVNIIANQRFGNGIRATLDGNNYRHRREEALTKLATRIAEQVKERGEEAVLDALPAFERRIVHKSLADYEGVSTYSEGEEPNRRVVIAPSD